MNNLLSVNLPPPPKKKVPQRTTLTVKFHWGNRRALLSRAGAWQNGQFGAL